MVYRAPFVSPGKKPQPRIGPRGELLDLETVKKVLCDKRLKTGDFPPQHIQFIKLYLATGNAREAALGAGFRSATAGQTLLKDARIKCIIEAAQEKRNERLDVQLDDVTRYWLDLAMADARELTPATVSCCRYCWGDDHCYQYTVNEMRALERQHLVAQLKLKPNDRRDMDREGGDEYDANRKPNPECPECFGWGALTGKAVDLSKLSRGAQLLFNGMRVFRDGSVEIKLRDRSEAMREFQELAGFVNKKPDTTVNVYNQQNNVTINARDRLAAQLELVSKRIEDEAREREVEAAG